MGDGDVKYFIEIFSSERVQIEIAQGFAREQLKYLIFSRWGPLKMEGEGNYILEPN